jgi:hypothetical protein
MLKWLLWIAAALVIIVGITVYFLMKGPDVSRYEYLKEPQIRKMPNQPVLVVEAKGDPNTVGGKAFSLLFKTYYSLKDSEKSYTVAPRARWPHIIATTPKDQWLGRYALPVSAIAKLPDNFKPVPGLKVSLEIWKYGTVAEILHIGPYSSETPTIERLRDFIKARGYRIIGEHEEEYVKGPSMFGPGDPNKYYTIIRYQIAK